MKQNLTMSLAASVPSLNEMILSAELEKRKERETMSSLDPAFEFAMTSLVKDDWEGIASSLRRDTGYYEIQKNYRMPLERLMVEYIQQNLSLSRYIDMSVATYDDLSRRARSELDSLEKCSKGNSSRLKELCEEKTKELYSYRLRSVVESYLDAHDVPHGGGHAKIDQATDNKILSLNTYQDFHIWYADKIADIVSMKGMRLVPASPWKRKPGTKHVAIREPAHIQFA